MRFTQEETNCQMTYIVTYARETQMIPSENMFPLEIQHSDWELYTVSSLIHTCNGCKCNSVCCAHSIKTPFKKVNTISHNQCPCQSGKSIELTVNRLYSMGATICIQQNSSNENCLHRLCPLSVEKTLLYGKKAAVEN